MSDAQGEYAASGNGDATTAKQWFAMVPATVIRDRRLKSGTRDVLTALLLYADAQGMCHPSQARIADDLGISREEVNRRMRTLKGLGYLTSDAPQTKGGTATYHLHLTPRCDETVTPSAQPVTIPSQGCDETVTPPVINPSHRTYSSNRPIEQREDANASIRPMPDGTDVAPATPSTPAPTPPSKPAAPAKTLPDDSDAMLLAAYLRDHILAHSPNARDAKAALLPAKLQQWARPIDLMLRIDGRTPDGIRAVIDFATTDSFWQSNILSPGKLRDQYDQLERKMRNRRTTAPPPTRTPQREPAPMLRRDVPLNARPAKLVSNRSAQS
jgi:Helix-turn-helix domain